MLPGVARQGSVVAAMFTGFVLVVLGALRRARNAPGRAGAQGMRGLSAEVLDWNETEGHVFTNGERWRARGADTFRPGERVEVANVVDLTLVVRRPDLASGEGGQC